MYSSPTCELCNEIEDSQHVFSCQNESLREARRLDFWSLKTKLRKITNPDVYSALVAGLGSIGGEGVRRYAAEFVTNRLLEEAFKEQEEIGWDNLARGRIARSWKCIGTTEEGSMEDTQWASKVTKMALDCRLKLWTHRNHMVHGNEAGISKMEIRKMRQTVTILYEELLPAVKAENRWLFDRPKESRSQEPYGLQVAWVDSVRQIYPEEFRDADRINGGKGLQDGRVTIPKRTPPTTTALAEFGHGKETGNTRRPDVVRKKRVVHVF